MDPNETRPWMYLLMFVTRSTWNVVGLVVGVAASYGLWHSIEPIRQRILFSAFAFVLIFFACLAIGIRQEYQDEDSEK